MRNITGQIVEGEDFFPRGADVRRYLKALETENLKLVFPRRGGKSSFVLHLAGELRQQGWRVATANVEDCASELDFVQRLLQILAGIGIESSLLDRLRRSLNSQVTSVKMGSFLEVKTQSGDSSPNTTLKEELRQLFERMDAGRQQILIALDEFPEVLHQIAVSPPDGPQRLSVFLHWLRQLRQTHRRQIRWIFYGSVGLDSFLERYQLGAQVNDLRLMDLEPLTVKEAHDFLNRLGAGAGLTLTPQVRQTILNRLGWPLPYFLQLMFDALTTLEVRDLQPAHVEKAFRQLLSPSRLSHYDTWHQRLERQFGVEDLRAARHILLVLCRDAAGRSKQQLFDHLMGLQPTADPLAVQTQLGQLLVTLEREGYLLQEDSRVFFRSFLLREYWKSKFAL
ncbi:MAG TPA: hypothetical protein DDY91_15195 [Planctomycetaceae bacterium]|nr:hypothetical protein [Planctomycetaceae bacterium]